MEPHFTIAHYTVEGILGSGAMGVVYKARDQQGKVYAIKSLKSSCNDQVVYQRFIDEIEICKNLLHPNIGIPVDHGEDPQPYIVFEYINGKSLAACIREGAYRDLDFTKITLEQITDGLSYVHDLGIIHGDLNPANIMITKDHRGKPLIKIVDFGIARLESAMVQLGQEVKKHNQAKFKGIFGTPGYIAPELFNQCPIDERADFFSYAAIAHKLLSGQSAFNRDVIWRTLVKPEFPPLGGVFRHIFSRALDADPEKRYASVGELFRLLSALIENEKFILLRGQWIKKMLEERPEEEKTLCLGTEHLTTYDFTEQ